MERIKFTTVGLRLINTIAIFFLLNTFCLSQQLVPIPQLYTPLSDKTDFKKGFWIVTNQDSLQVESAFLEQRLLQLGIPKTKNGVNIYLKITKRVQNAEGYAMGLSKKLEIEAATRKGIFYGIQSFLQHFIDSSLAIGNFQIVDEPKFVWRGLLLDCCRHFMDTAFIKKTIDIMAMHKLNVLHWHLTEDQGWRIAIKSKPKLTSIGAYRKEKDGSTYGGFYTQEQVKAIVAYAASKHIMVVPEIEMPGHALAAIASYPKLSCTGKPVSVTSEWGVFKDIYCAGNPATFKFIAEVFDEIIPLFPSPYVHIGGDEAPKVNWHACKKCQKVINKYKLKDEYELQSWFINKVAVMLKAKGKLLIGWDEITEGSLPKGTVVQSWRGTDGAITAINQNQPTIMSPTSHCYLDYSLAAIDLRKIYSFNPIPPGIAVEKHNLVLGGEGNMWTEYAPQSSIESKIWPRLSGLAEVLWSGPGRDFEAFNQRMETHYDRLKAMDCKYGLPTVPIVQATTIDTLSNTLELSLIPQLKGISIAYSAANKPFQSYSNKLFVSRSTDFKYTYSWNNETSNDTQWVKIAIHDGLGKPLTVDAAPSQNYLAGGKSALLDGKSGRNNFRDGNWQGYLKENITAVVDLKTIKNIQSVACGFLEYANAWIFYPDTVFYYGSNDAMQYTLLGFVTKPESRPTLGETNTKKFEVRMGDVQFRFLKMVAVNRGVCPPWHEAAGEPAWLFADEWIINERKY